MSQTVDQIATAIAQLQLEDAKFEKGNNSAGTRARKVLQEIAKLAKVRRAEISETRIARKEAKVG